MNTVKIISDYIYLLKNCSQLLFRYCEFMNTINNVNNLYLSYSILLFSNLRKNKHFGNIISKKKRVNFYLNWNTYQKPYFYFILSIIFSL